MRERIYRLIEKSDGDDKHSSVYDAFMILVIVLSLIPLAFKQDNKFLFILDKVTVVIFIIDYLLRWCTAEGACCFYKVSAHRDGHNRSSFHSSLYHRS